MIRVKIMEPYPITGVILAGGKNKRMKGKPKAFLTFNNETFLERQLKEMQSIAKEIFVIANSDFVYYKQFESSGIRVFSDEYKEIGPLGGFHKGLLEARESYIWLLGCDMPFPSAAAVKWMYKKMQQEKVQAIIPYIYGKYHPLHSLYHVSCLSIVTQMINRKERTLTQLTNFTNCSYLTEETCKKHEIDLKFVTNVNTPEDYVGLR